MKVFKSIMFWFLNILSIPLTIITATGIVWYILPLGEGLQIYDFINQHVSTQLRFWLTVGCGFLLAVIMGLQFFFGKNQRSKVKNFFIHTNTWLACFISVVFAIASFAVNTISTEGIEVGIPQKIMIGVDIVFLLCFHIFAGKISKVLNRKIQAYENSKEINVIGRSSIIVINLLKLLEFIFPEMLVLLLLCLMLSWNVAGYFTMLLIGFTIPMIGNIICDFNARKEIAKLNEEQHQKLVNDVANKIKGDIKK